jgi:hypothetical protein
MKTWVIKNLRTGIKHNVYAMSFGDACRQAKENPLECMIVECYA